MSDPPPPLAAAEAEAEAEAGPEAEADASHARALARLRHTTARQHAALAAQLADLRTVVSELVPADARARRHGLQRRLDTSGAEVPSLLELLDLQPDLETRFTLLLASLLDPRRTGLLAPAVWRALAAYLRERVARAPGEPGEPGAEHTRVALEAWRLDQVSAAVVAPETHGAEWRNLDVFARVEGSGGVPAFGLVVEAKVRPGTGEQQQQLDRYWWEIQGLDRRAAPGTGPETRTVFLFLTRTERRPHTAVESREAWLCMRWGEVATVVERATEEVGDPAAEILGRQVVRLLRGTLTDRDPRPRAEAALLLSALGEDPDETALRAHHATLCDLETRWT